MNRLKKVICGEVITFLKQNGMRIYYLILFANPYLVWFFVNEDLRQNRVIPIIAYIFPALLFLSAFVWKNAAKQTGYQQGVPIARKRFTRRDDRGRAEIDMGDLTEIVAYLAEVEDVLERRGEYLNK